MLYNINIIVFMVSFCFSQEIITSRYIPTIIVTTLNVYFCLENLAHSISQTVYMNSNFFFIMIIIDPSIRRRLITTLLLSEICIISLSGIF